MKTIYSFIGLPASGKGTQSAILAEKLGVSIVGMGDLIREEMKKDSSDPFVAAIIGRYNTGTPQPDDVAVKLLENYLESSAKDVILDNFPLTEGQAKFLSDYLSKHNEWQGPIVIYINLDPEIAIKRAITRKICSNCKAVYGAMDDIDKCTKCGGELIIRSDDNEEVMRKRIGHYVPMIDETINYYKSIDGTIIEIDGTKTVPEVTAEVEEKLTNRA